MGFKHLGIQPSHSIPFPPPLSGFHITGLPSAAGVGNKDRCIVESFCQRQILICDTAHIGS